MKRILVLILFFLYIVFCFGDSSYLTYGGVFRDNQILLDGLNRPSAVTISPDGIHLYVISKGDSSISWLTFVQNDFYGTLIYCATIKNGQDGVEGLRAPSSVTVSPEGKHVYVTAEYGFSISWFTRDPCTGNLAYGGILKDGQGGVDGLWGANSANISPDGKYVYVAAPWDSSVSWFARDTSNGALTYSGILKDGQGGVDGLNGANSVIISPNGKHVYVAAYVDSSVSWFVRDTLNGALTYSGILKDGQGGVDGLNGANSVIISPDGKHIYVAADSSVSWFTRDTSTGTLAYAGTIKDGQGGADGLWYANSINISPNGEHVYITANWDSTVAWFVRNTTTGALIYGGVIKDEQTGTFVGGLGGPNSVMVSPDGRHVLVTAALDSSLNLFLRDTSTGSLSHLITYADGQSVDFDADCPVSLTLSPDGRHVYVASSDFNSPGGSPFDNSVSWFNRNDMTGALVYYGGHRVGLVNGLKNPRSVIISPDGKHVYVFSMVDSAITWFTRNNETGSLTWSGLLKEGGIGILKVLDQTALPNAITASPNGKYIYAVTYFNKVSTSEYEHGVLWFARDTNTGSLTYGGIPEGIPSGGALGRPNVVAVSPDGKYVYITCGNIGTGKKGNLAWFSCDTNTGKLNFSNMLDSVEGLNMPSSIVISPDGQYLYVSVINGIMWFIRNSSSGDLSYGGICKTHPIYPPYILGYTSMALSIDGQYIIATATSAPEAVGVVAWFKRDTLTGEVIFSDVIKDGPLNPTAVVVSSDNKHVYVTANWDSSVSWFIVDTTSQTTYLNKAILSYAKNGITVKPNPFNPIIYISSQAPISGKFGLKIYDLQGRVVATLKSGLKTIGKMRFLWNATSTPSGIYIIRCSVGKNEFTRRIVLLK